MALPIKNLVGTNSSTEVDLSLEAARKTLHHSEPSVVFTAGTH